MKSLNLLKINEVDLLIHNKSPAEKSLTRPWKALSRTVHIDHRSGGIRFGTWIMARISKLGGQNWQLYNSGASYFQRRPQLATTNIFTYWNKAKYQKNDIGVKKKKSYMF